jgi:hypothetical protein
MPISAQMPDIMGERQSGQDVRTQNGNRPSLLLPSRHKIYRYAWIRVT